MPFMIFDQKKNSIQYIGNSQYKISKITVDVKPDYDPDALRRASNDVAKSALTKADSFTAHNFASLGTKGLPDSNGPWAFGSFAMTLRQLKPFTDKKPSGTMEIEAYYDKNKNGKYDANEPFIDTNKNGRYDTGGETNPLTESYSGRGFYRANSSSDDDRVAYHAVFSGQARRYDWSLDPSAIGYRSGMDIHAGRYDTKSTFMGYAANSALGCIRTSDESLARLDQLHGITPTTRGTTIETGLLIVKDVKYVGVDRSIVLSAGQGNVALVDSRDFVVKSKGEFRTLKAGAGDDFLFGSKHSNILSGGAGGDYIYGKGGADTIKGEAGGDKLYGGTGDDTIYAGSSTSDTGDKNTVGQKLDKKIFGTALSIADFADGGAGNDKVYGAGGADYLVGGVGSDYIYGNDGGDYIVGDLSLASLKVLAPRTFDFDYFNALASSGFKGDGDYVFLKSSDEGFIAFSVKDSNKWADHLFGGDGLDFIYGGSGNDEIDGGDDDDRLFGGTGHDTIYGGGGNDHLFGGPGDDTLDGGEGSDYYFLSDGAGVYNGNDFVDDTGVGPENLDIVFFENADRPWQFTGIELYVYGGLKELVATAPGDAGLNVSKAGSKITLVDGSSVELDDGFDYCTISDECTSAIITQFGANDQIDISAFGATYTAFPTEEYGTFVEIQDNGISITRNDENGTEFLLSLLVITTGASLNIDDFVLI